jgi:hypothetical protein
MNCSTSQSRYFGKRSLESPGQHRLHKLSANSLNIQLGNQVPRVSCHCSIRSATRRHRPSHMPFSYQRFDKMSFHMYQKAWRIPQLPCNTFFKDNSNQLYVSLSNSRSSNYVAKSLSCLLHSPTGSQPTHYPSIHDHPFVSSFCLTSSMQPLSLSTNAEDELASRKPTATSVELGQPSLFEVLSRSQN